MSHTWAKNGNMMKISSGTKLHGQSFLKQETRHHLPIFMSKWLIKCLPTGVVMKKWKQRLHARCPHCQHEQEDTLHLTTCTSQAITDLWATKINSLESWMAYKDTNPDLQTFTISGLVSWLQDPHSNELSLSSFPPHKQTSFQKQLHLGWYAFLTGLIHPSILHIQKYYSNKQRRTTGASWTSNLTQHIWKILYDLWLLWNQALHQWTIDSNHRLENLDHSIMVEYHLGPLSLPSHFNGYFSMSLASILSKSTELKKMV